MKSSTAALVALTILLAAVTCSYADPDPATITVVHSIGLDEVSLILNRPIDIAWSAGGTAYVLNSGDNTVVALSPEWEHAFSFGGRGEAPGELNRPSMMEVVNGEIWIKVPRGIEIFDARGEYVRLQRLPLQVASVHLDRGGFVGVSSYAEGIGVRYDANGKILSVFGPTGSERTDPKSLIRATSWLALPGGDGCTLLDRFDGEAWRWDDGERTGKTFDLHLGRGSFTGDFRCKRVISDATVDPDGGCFVIHYPESDSVGQLVHYDDSWQQDGCWNVPGDAHPGIVRVSPRGEICLLEEAGSILYVCARPATSCLSKNGRSNR